MVGVCNPDSAHSQFSALVNMVGDDAKASRRVLGREWQSSEIWLREGRRHTGSSKQINSQMDTKLLLEAQRTTIYYYHVCFDCPFLCNRTNSIFIENGKLI